RPRRGAGSACGVPGGQGRRVRGDRGPLRGLPGAGEEGARGRALYVRGTGRERGRPRQAAEVVRPGPAARRVRRRWPAGRGEGTGAVRGVAGGVRGQGLRRGSRRPLSQHLPPVAVPVRAAFAFLAIVTTMRRKI